MIKQTLIVIVVLTTACSNSSLLQSQPECGTVATLCDGVCADLSSDNQNCGACAVACAAGSACTNGACGVTCGAGYINCSGSCIDPNTSPEHCGASASCLGANSGSVCAADQTCRNGQCTTVCPSGEILCAGRCVDPRNDTNFCGATLDCAGNNAGVACPGAEQCTDGACACPAANPSTCGAGAGTICTDLQTDPLNCGGCGTNCGASAACQDGGCVTQCGTGLVNCNGSCIDPTSNAANCGAFGNCVGANAGSACSPGQICQASQCTTICSEGEIVCAQSCIEPLSDTNFCGATADCWGGNAGTKCSAGQQCTGGNCSCPTARPDVCGSGATGFCTDFSTDDQNCGSCGYECPSGQQCAEGACACPSPTPSACTSSGGVGFCTNEQTDPNNCGTCEHSCEAGMPCVEGVCGCASGQIACGGECIDPLSNPNFCGASADCTGGTVCTSSELCSAGTCVPNCSWQTVANYALTSAPAGSMQAGGLNGNQTTETIDGRTGYTSTADWMDLLVPTGLGANDDVFALEIDVDRIGALTGTNRITGVNIFANHAVGSNVPYYLNNYGEMQGVWGGWFELNGGAKTMEWMTQPPPVPTTGWLPNGTMGPLTVTGSVAETIPTDSWHTLRIEGVRSTCHFRMLVDGILMSTYSGACDVSGNNFAFYVWNGHSFPIDAAWSNLKIYKGAAASCIP